jgi:DNA-binding winged helix-turn-helix (wHTH) protein
MVRQGLRAVVSGRQTIGNVPNTGIRRNMDSIGQNSSLLIDTSNNNSSSNNILINQHHQQQQQQQQQTSQQQIANPMEMDSQMRFNFDMPQGT